MALHLILPMNSVPLLLPPCEMQATTYSTFWFHFLLAIGAFTVADGGELVEDLLVRSVNFSEPICYGQDPVSRIEAEACAQHLYVQEKPSFFCVLLSQHRHLACLAICHQRLRSIPHPCSVAKVNLRAVASLRAVFPVLRPQFKNSSSI